FKGGAGGIAARFETGRSFVLHGADCCRPPHADAPRVASELSWDAWREPGGLHCTNRIRRRFLVRDFRSRFSRGHANEPDLPSVRGDPCNQNIARLALQMM